MKKGKVLIVDDHKHVLNALRHLLIGEFETVKTLSNPNRILNELECLEYNVVLLDMNFSAGINTGNEGFYWLNQIKKYDSDIIVILITAFGDIELAIKAVKAGATDFILKPWNNDKLVFTLKSALELSESKKELKSIKTKQSHLNRAINQNRSDILGNSDAIKQVIRSIEKVAKTDASVLITGENGTGKELVAREIHNKSNRVDQVFMDIDLTTINESLFESELFGHKGGSFTDAKSDRTGKFELSSSGTLFLDEIGNLPYLLQAKILTALERREITPIGSSEKIPFDCRLISATNKDLKKLVNDHLFREDLFFRINTIVIDVPPLRERGNDIVLLAEHFLKLYADKYNKYPLKINNAALDNMVTYQWPGNIRELRHLIERTVIFCEESTLKPKDFQLPKSENATSNIRTLAEIEKQTISNALIKHNRKISEVAKELGLARQTLYNKIQKYGL